MQGVMTRRIATIAAGLVALVGACSSSDSSPDRAAPRNTTTTTTTVRTTSASTVPSGPPVPASFAPVSVTFVSLREGWVLGTAPCAPSPCTPVAHTTDGGKSWALVASVPSPVSEDGAESGGVRTIRFANGRDGWAYGPELWATHDGGAHWQRVGRDPLTPTTVVFDLEAAAGTVHAAVFDTSRGSDIRIVSSPVGADGWRASPTTVPLGAGPVPDAQIVLQGRAGWMLEVDRTVVGGAQLDRGAWGPWQPPCSDAGGDVTLDASSPTDVVAVCNEGVWNDHPKMTRLYVSNDGGRTFHVAGRPLPMAVSAVATSAPDVVVAGGSDTNGSTLDASFDRGATWRAVERHDLGGGWADLGVPSPRQGVAVELGDSGRPDRLVMTFDGGHTWRVVDFTG